jgi:hypothetical protein
VYGELLVGTYFENHAAHLQTLFTNIVDSLPEKANGSQVGSRKQIKIIKK